MTQKIDLGDGHAMAFVMFRNEVVGVNVYHPDRESGRGCMGWVPFAGRAWANGFAAQPITAWQVEQDDPLTLAPSIRCRTCGDHGFIRAGRWVRA